MFSSPVFLLGALGKNRTALARWQDSCFDPPCFKPHWLREAAKCCPLGVWGGVQPLLCWLPRWQSRVCAVSCARWFWEVTVKSQILLGHSWRGWMFIDRIKRKCKLLEAGHEGQALNTYLREHSSDYSVKTQKQQISGNSFLVAICLCLVAYFMHSICLTDNPVQHRIFLHLNSRSQRCLFLKIYWKAIRSLGREISTPFSAVKLCDSKCLLEIHTAYFFVGTDTFKRCLKIGAGWRNCLPSDE